MKGTREQAIEDLCISSMIAAIITVVIIAVGDEVVMWKTIVGGALMYFAIMQIIFNMIEVFLRTKGNP